MGEQREGRRWPRLSTVVKVWGALTLLGIGIAVWVIRQGPPDEEMMFREFSGQLVLATMLVGIPSYVGLLLFLLVGSLTKRLRDST